MTRRSIEREIRPWAESRDQDEVVAALFILDQFPDLPLAVPVWRLRAWHVAKIASRAPDLFGLARRPAFTPRSRLICNELLQRIHARDLRSVDHG